MSPQLLVFSQSPLKAKLSDEFCYFFAHRLKEKEASWGSEHRRAFKFRLQEYFRDGRIESLDPEAIPQDQGKQFRTINLEFEEKIVATVTLFFPLRGQYWKMISSLKDQEWREFFFSQQDEAIEIKNLIIHPEFRGTDVILRIFQIVHRELVRSNRKLLVTSCVDPLISKYEAIAFKRTGLSFQRDYGRPDELHLLYSCQFKYGAYGLHVGPLKWGVYLSRIARQLRAEYPHGFLQRTILSVYDLLTPIALSLYYAKVYYRWFKWERSRSSSRNISFERSSMAPGSR